MITLTVTSYKGAAAAGNLSVSFDELGGTIGRADTNQMVLPDPDRAISRIHAQVAFRGGSYALIGRGANPVLHNGKALGHGAEVALADGDRVDIGSYGILVSTRQTAKNVDPFEAAFGDSAQHQRPAPAAPMAVAPKPLLPATPRAETTGPGPSAGANSRPSGFGIPDDWDPFAQEARADAFGGLAGASNLGHQPPSAPVARAPVVVPQAAREDSLDAMFGLGAGAPKDNPFASSPLAPVVAQPNTSAASDPMRALLEPARAGVMAESDHVSDLNSPWVNNGQPVKPPPPAQRPPLPGAVFSWDGDAGAAKVAGPAPAAPPAPARTTPSPNNQGLAGRAPVLPPPEAPVAAMPTPNTQAPGARDQELLAALRDGLGTPDLRLAALTPEMMRQLGQLLRESTKGTVELLAARAALKREVRADVTSILASANNSLKFSPSVEVALQYLLGPRMTGFMPPVESMRDAYDDLKAHQLGVMAGMKAALAGVLQRFDPAVVESKLTGRSALSSLIPSSRKARLWEMFQELYQQLATEAEEDFNTIFGSAFLRAYQQYIEQLDGKDANR